VVTELVDHPDDVIYIALSGVAHNVGGKSFLTSIANLPFRGEVPITQDHPHGRPSQKRQSLAADLGEIHRTSIIAQPIPPIRPT
jgi:hypothetical protein